MADPTITGTGAVKRAEFKLFADVGEAESPEWELQGDRIEELSLELNPDVETVTDVTGVTATTLDKVGALAESQGASLYEIIRNADLFPELKASSAKLLKFADLIDGLRRAGTELAPPGFYDAVCDQTGYVKALEEKNDMESRGRIENVQELKSNILGFLEQQPEDATLSGFLNEIALYTDLDSVEASDDCVTMMTIHSAKGLEFPVVYVVGMEEGIFPGASAQYDQEELEEDDGNLPF